MEKKEDLGLPKPRLLNKSIETLCQPPPLEKYTEVPSPSPSKKKPLFPRSILLIKIILFFALVALLIGGFYKFAWPLSKPAPSHSFVSLRSPCPDFVGREKYLDTLYKELITKWKPGTVRIQGLWGKGGFGKTELALEFANRFRDSFSFIWTFYCDSKESLQQGYQDLAKQLGVLNPSDTHAKTQEKVHFYFDNASLEKPWLLIFDNVEDSLPDYPQRGGAVLFTTQKKILNPQFLIELTPFTKEESIELLENITGEERNHSMEELAHDLERIPLLINYAAHFIKSTPGCNTSDYQTLFCKQLFEKAGPLWKEMDVNRRYLKSLASSWQFSLNALEKENPEALAWLYVCSYLYPENIPETWIDDWLASKSALTVEIRRRAILQALQNYGIIHFQEKTRTFSLHRFFLYMVRESRQAYIQEDLFSAFALLNEHAEDYNYFQSLSWEAGKNWHMHACAFTQWMDKYPEFFSDPVSLNNKAHLLTAIGFWNHFNYHFSTSIDNFSQALSIYKSLMDKLSSECALNYIWIGFSQQRLGNYREGLRILNEVEDLFRASIQERPLELIALLDLKGICHFELNEYDQAFHAFKEGLQITSIQNGGPHVKGSLSYDMMNAILLGNVGRCLREIGRYEEAIDYFEQALGLLNKICGKGHPYYLLYTGEKAYLDTKMGYPKKALQLIQNTLNEYVALNGKEFGEQTAVWYVMGHAYLHLNELKKAHEMFKKTKSMSLQYFGKNFSMLRRTYREMSHLYLKEKRFRKGLKYLLKHLQMSVNSEIKPEKIAPIFHEFQHILKRALEAKRSLRSIQKTSREVALLSEKIFGKDHPLTAYFLETSSTVDNSKVKI